VRAEVRPMPKVRLLPSSLSTGRRWTEDDARAVLDAHTESGLSVAAFAAREGLDPQRVYSWRRRLGRSVEAVEAISAPAFIEIRSSAKCEVVEVVLRCGRVVRVTELIDPSVLRRLVDALEGNPSC
jgi:transposase-like protein